MLEEDEDKFVDLVNDIINRRLGQVFEWLQRRLVDAIGRLKLALMASHSTIEGVFGFLSVPVVWIRISLITILARMAMSLAMTSLLALLGLVTPCSNVGLTDNCTMTHARNRRCLVLATLRRWHLGEEIICTTHTASGATVKSTGAWYVGDLDLLLHHGGWTELGLRLRIVSHLLSANNLAEPIAKLFAYFLWVHHLRGQTSPVYQHLADDAWVIKIWHRVHAFAYQVLLRLAPLALFALCRVLKLI